MTDKGWSVGRIAEVVGFARSAARGRDERVVIHVLVDKGYASELAHALREALMPERPSGEVEVFDAAYAEAPDQACDAAIALVGPQSDMGAVRRYARSGVPVGLVVESALDVPPLGLDEGPASLVRVIATSDARALGPALAEWLVSIIDKDIALAANFAFCRDVVARRLIRRCAAENAAVGAIDLVPGADLPVMTANQMRLALDIAACYSLPFEGARAIELAGVVVASLGWRRLARTLVELAPGLSGLLRAGVAFGGTAATGEVLRLRCSGTLRADGGAPAPEASSDERVPAHLDKAEDLEYVAVQGRAS